MPLVTFLHSRPAAAKTQIPLR